MDAGIELKENRQGRIRCGRKRGRKSETLLARVSVKGAGDRAKWGLHGCKGRAKCVAEHVQREACQMGWQVDMARVKG